MRKVLKRTPFRKPPLGSSRELATRPVSSPPNTTIITNINKATTPTTNENTDTETNTKTDTNTDTDADTDTDTPARARPNPPPDPSLDLLSSVFGAEDRMEDEGSDFFEDVGVSSKMREIMRSGFEDRRTSHLRSSKPKPNLRRAWEPMLGRSLEPRAGLR